MHTSRIGGTVFHHNGDYSGEVVITTADASKLSVAFEDLKGFVAQYLREQAIERIEQKRDDDVLREAKLGNPHTHQCKCGHSVLSHWRRPRLDNMQYGPCDGGCACLNFEPKER